MERLKKIVLIESIVIFVLFLYLIYNYSTASNVIGEKILYCEKYQYEDKTCLISARISSGAEKPQNFLLNFAPLKKDIQNYIQANNLNTSMYFVNLRDSSTFGINPDISFQPASLNKLPIAMIILKKVEEGELSLDDYLLIKDYHRDSSS